MADAITLRLGNQEHQVRPLADDRVDVDGGVVKVLPRHDGSVSIDGDAGRAVAWTAVAGDARWVFYRGRTYVFEVQRLSARRRGGGHHGTLSAPMPATVRRILVSPGDSIRRGDMLIVLEAMKMELPVRAAADGVVEAVRCEEGQLVQPGVALIEIEQA